MRKFIKLFPEFEHLIPMLTIGNIKLLMPDLSKYDSKAKINIIINPTEESENVYKYLEKQNRVTMKADEIDALIAF